MAIDIAGHACAQVWRPWKHKEGWSSTNKCICISNVSYDMWICMCKRPWSYWIYFGREVPQLTPWWWAILNTADTFIYKYSMHLQTLPLQVEKLSWFKIWRICHFYIDAHFIIHRQCFAINAYCIAIDACDLILNNNIYSSRFIVKEFHTLPFCIPCIMANIWWILLLWFIKICDWLSKNPHSMHQNWNLFYCIS